MKTNWALTGLWVGYRLGPGLIGEILIHNNKPPIKQQGQLCFWCALYHFDGKREIARGVCVCP